MRRTGIADQGLEEINLSLAGKLRERHEHLGGSEGKLTDKIFDNRLAANIATLVPETVENTAGGMPILLVNLAVCVKKALDPFNVGAKLGRDARNLLAVARRGGMFEDLL